MEQSNLKGSWVVNDERHLPDGDLFVEDNLGVVAIVTNEENAPLIAAAPDMLRALRGLVSKLGGWPMPGMKEEFDAAVLAIAKAAGQ